MANEITVSFNAQVVNGLMRKTIQLGQMQIDQAAVGRAGHTQEIGTSSEVVDLGDVSTNGMLYLRNLDETNFITFGTDDVLGIIFAELKPGEFAWLRLAPTVVLYAQADTAACLLDVSLFED